VHEVLGHPAVGHVEHGEALAGPLAAGGRQAHVDAAGLAERGRAVAVRALRDLRALRRRERDPPVAELVRINLDARAVP
jgi:hypothetical protein